MGIKSLKVKGNETPWDFLKILEYIGKDWPLIDIASNYSLYTEVGWDVKKTPTSSSAMNTDC